MLPLAQRVLDPAREKQDKSVMETKFWECFGEQVSEWNPCFSDDGEQRIRFLWDPDVGAHDVEVLAPSGGLD